MDKLDFVKQDKNLYNPPAEPQLVDVPHMRYIMVDGQGIPEGNKQFEEAFSALFGLAYTIKFMAKKGDVPEGSRDFKVPPPEGLWWMADNSEFSMGKPDKWRWTLMIRMPDFVTQTVVDRAASELAAKKKSNIYHKVRLGEVEEGKSVQLMHIGPYDAERVNIEKMDQFAASQGYHYAGKHHEIYLGDPRRTRPEKLRTLLRHPVIR